MAVYYRWRQSEFQSVLGTMGIDSVVNSQDTKLLIQRLYKADLQTRRWIQEREEAEDKKANIAYSDWLERNLGWSLRNFLKYGDRYPIVQWMRRYGSDICFYIAICYGAFLIFFAKHGG